MSRLDDAIRIALSVHREQLDKADKPYILHPLRVMCNAELLMRGENIKDKESVLCSSVLHDSIEDSHDKLQTATAICYQCGDVVLKTVQSLTRGSNETWNSYLQRVERHWAPRFIKILDLEDNIDLSRLPAISEEDLLRTNRYNKAFDRLHKRHYGT